MVLMLAASLLAALVAAWLAWTLVRDRPAPVGGAVPIYEDQLAEVARDEGRGLLGPAEAAQARAEVERRLLDAARRERAGAIAPRRGPRLSFVAATAALPLAAGGLYLASGNPGLPDRAHGARAAAPSVEALRARLSDDPADLDAWVALARALAAQGRRADALPAYAEAVRLTGGRDRRLAGDYAEAMALEAGRVTPAAEEIFAAILARHPDDPQATYYLAQAKAARGDRAGAAADLDALLARADPAAPWYAGMAALRAELAEGAEARDRAAPGAVSP